jgi:hypothetical protein
VIRVEARSTCRTAIASHDAARRNSLTLRALIHSPNCPTREMKFPAAQTRRRPR